MKLTANIDECYIALTVPHGGYADAARAGNIAGLELAVKPELRIGSALNEQGQRTYRDPPVLILDFHPDTGRALAIMLAQKMGLPIFTEPEWQTIAQACEIAAAMHDSNQERYAEHAKRIRTATS